MLCCLIKYINLKQRRAHFYAERFGFGRTSHGATVVIGGHQYWPLTQIRPKQPFTRYIKVITTNDPIMDMTLN